MSLARLTSYMDLCKIHILMNMFLIPSLITAHLFGCFINGRITRKLTDYTKDASGIFITINNKVLNNF